MSRAFVRWRGYGNRIKPACPIQATPGAFDLILFNGETHKVFTSQVGRFPVNQRQDQ